MNQVKYILFACLILLSGIVCFSLAKNFFSTNVVKQQPSPVIIDNYSTDDSLSESETDGKILFDKDCMMCHGIFKTDDFFLGFENRGPWSDRKELYKWIHNPEDYIKHDKTGYTRALKEKFYVSMLPSPELSYNDIDKILDYLHKAYLIRNTPIP